MIDRRIVIVNCYHDGDRIGPRSKSLYPIRFIRTCGSIYHFSYSMVVWYMLHDTSSAESSIVIGYKTTIFTAEVVLCSQSEYQRINGSILLMNLIVILFWQRMWRQQINYNKLFQTLVDQKTVCKLNLLVIWLRKSISSLEILQSAVQWINSVITYRHSVLKL